MMMMIRLCVRGIAEPGGPMGCSSSENDSIEAGNSYSKTRLRVRLDNLYCRQLLRRISIYSTPTEPTSSLYCNYVELTLVTVSYVA